MPTRIDNLTPTAGEVLGLDDALAAKADASSLSSHTEATDNPHEVTASQVGAYTTGEVDGLISAITYSDVGAAAASHTHDDRYYTETETNSLLSGKSDTSHNHALSSLADVSAGGIASGDVLMWNGSAFEELSANVADGYLRLDSDGEIKGPIINRFVLDTDDTDIAKAGEIVAVVDDLTTPTTFEYRAGDGDAKTENLPPLSGFAPGTGTSSAVLGGSRTGSVASGDWSLAVGSKAIADTDCMISQGAVQDGSTVSRSNTYILSAETIDTTPKTIFITPPSSGQATLYRIRIVAVNASGGVKAFERRYLQDAVGAGGPGPTETIGTDLSTSGPAVSIYLTHTAGGDLSITLTGISATIGWTIYVHATTVEMI